MNYWQSEDGKDKRLILQTNSFLQEIDAKTGKSILSFGDKGLVNMRDGLARAEGTATRVASASPGKVMNRTRAVAVRIQAVSPVSAVMDVAPPIASREL